jgi:hypothetical protein
LTELRWSYFLSPFNYIAVFPARAFRGSEYFLGKEFVRSFTGGPNRPGSPS